MRFMSYNLLIGIVVVSAMTAPPMAAEPYEPWPSKVQLRSIEKAAYTCSRDNSTQACTLVRHSLPTL